MLTTTTQRNNTPSSKMRFYPVAPVLPDGLIKVTEQIKTEKKDIADKDGNAFWLDIMHCRAENNCETRYAIAPPLMRELEKAGRRLECDPRDNYALALVSSMILNRVYLASLNGDDCYQKFFPHNKKTGGLIPIRFTSEYFCQHARADYVPVYMTGAGAVRSRIHTCGKAWTCPVCAAKIAVRRNLEVHTILNKARSKGMTVIMITLTIPHYINQPLLYLSELNQKAYLHLFNSVDIKKMKEHYNWFGTIKTMETTMNGKNGWHNHFHVVLIFDKKIDKYDEMIILNTFKKQWEKSCIKYGLLDVNNEKSVADFYATSVNLKRDFDPDYIAKQSDEWKREHRVSETWGAAEELTLGKLKKGNGSCTAFGFVARMARRAALGCYTISEMERDADLFIEFACAMHGRSMVQFSKNLRKWAGLDEEKTDQDICEEQKEHGDLVGGFDKEQHAFVRSHALWRPFKKLLLTDMMSAIKTINEIFGANGLRHFYSKEEIEGYIFTEDVAFPEFDVPKEETPPPKLAKCAQIGKVCPKISLNFEQLSLFISDNPPLFED